MLILEVRKTAWQVNETEEDLAQTGDLWLILCYCWWGTSKAFFPPIY